MKIILIDTETTGLEDGRLIQLAYKNLENGKIINELFKPEKPIEIQAMATHHITEEDVADKPVFEGSKIQKEVTELSNTHIFVAHNAKFDIDILKKDGIIIKNYICTKKLAYHYYDEDSYSLQYLRYAKKLNNSQLKQLMPHDALCDILVMEQLFLELKNEIEQEIKNSNENIIIEKMLKITNNPQLIRKFHFGKYKNELIKNISIYDRGYLDWLNNQSNIDEDLKYTLEFYLND